MNEREDLCVVCGEPSSALICSECEALIGAKPLRSTPTVGATPARTLAGVQADD